MSAFTVKEFVPPVLEEDYILPADSHRSSLQKKEVLEIIALGSIK